MLTECELDRLEVRLLSNRRDPAAVEQLLSALDTLPASHRLLRPDLPKLTLGGRRFRRRRRTAGLGIVLPRRRKP